jgi:hypothetical protein
MWKSMVVAAVAAAGIVVVTGQSGTADPGHQLDEHVVGGTGGVGDNGSRQVVVPDATTAMLATG